MRMTKPVHVPARHFNDEVLVAMSIADATQETNALMVGLFENSAPPSRSVAISKEAGDGLYEWLIRTFPHHVAGAEPGLLRFGLADDQVQHLHYRLADFPATLQQLYDECQFDVPGSDVVVLASAQCGRRLAEMVVSRLIRMAVCQAAVFED